MLIIALLIVIVGLLWILIKLTAEHSKYTETIGIHISNKLQGKEFDHDAHLWERPNYMLEYLEMKRKEEQMKSEKE